MDNRLMHATTVVVGEANTGKTTKLMEIAKRCHEEGRKVRFLSLDTMPIYLKQCFNPPFDVDAASHLIEIDHAMRTLPPSSVLVIDMLSLATVDTGKMDQVGLLSNTLDVLHHRAQERGIELIVSVQARRGYGMGGMDSEGKPLILPEAVERGDYNIVWVGKD